MKECEHGFRVSSSWVPSGGLIGRRKVEEDAGRRGFEKRLAKGYSGAMAKEMDSKHRIALTVNPRFIEMGWTERRRTDYCISHTLTGHWELGEYLTTVSNKKLS